MDEISRNRYVSYYYLATVYTSLGELDKAFEYLDLAYEDVDADLVLLNVDSKFDALHSDPRYEALLKKIGLGR